MQLFINIVVANNNTLLYCQIQFIKKNDNYNTNNNNVVIIQIKD